MAVVINIAMAEEGLTATIVTIATIAMITMTAMIIMIIVFVTERSLRERECSYAGKEFVRVMTKTDLNAAAYRTAASAVAAAASAIYSDKYFDLNTSNLQKLIRYS